MEVLHDDTNATAYLARVKVLEIYIVQKNSVVREIVESTQQAD